MFETRYADGFKEPNLHSEVFDMVVDLNRKYLNATGACIYNPTTCERIEQRYAEAGSKWLSDNLSFGRADGFRA